MKRFQYQQLTVITEQKGEMVFVYENKMLNYHTYFSTVVDLMGSQGWEMTSVTPLTETSLENQALLPIYADTIASNMYTSGLIFYFKRELEENEKVILDEAILQELEAIDEVNENIQNLLSFSSKEEVIAHYEAEGYKQGLDYPQRITFEKWNSDEDKYDTVKYDLVDGVWKLK